MIDAEEPIPPEEILLLEGFEYFLLPLNCQFGRPQDELNPREKTGLERKPEAWDEYYHAQRDGQPTVAQMVDRGEAHRVCARSQAWPNAEIASRWLGRAGRIRKWNHGQFCRPGRSFQSRSQYGCPRVSGGRCFLFAANLRSWLKQISGRRRRSGRPRKHDWNEGELCGKELLKTKGDPTKPGESGKGLAVTGGPRPRHHGAHGKAFDRRSLRSATAQDVAARLLKDFNG